MRVLTTPFLLINDVKIMIVPLTLTYDETSVRFDLYFNPPEIIEVLDSLAGMKTDASIQFMDGEEKITLSGMQMDKDVSFIGDPEIPLFIGIKYTKMD